MLLQLKTIDPEKGLRVFSCWLLSLEQTFDFLSELSGEGTQLIEAKLIDKGHCLPLPTEAFDGAPLSGSIRQLEREWQHVLGQPSQNWLAHYQWCMGQLNQQLAAHQDYTSRLTLALKTTESNRRRVQERPYRTSIQARLDQRYESLVDRYEQLLAKAQIRDENLRQHLHQLQASVEELV
ncbi:hypothetical protein [Spirosoma aerophilum]